MLEWSDKHFQAAAINMIKQLITNCLETNEKLKKKLSKEIEMIKNNQLETKKYNNKYKNKTKHLTKHCQ